MSKSVEAHVLREYSLVREMGSGAYGHVWEVKDNKSNRTYALKKVFDAFRNSVDAQRTYREVEVLHKLSQQNIIKLYRVIKSRNRKDLYLVFEFMEADLHSIVGTDLLEKNHQVFVFYQALKGICYLHSAQLIHRDLKPSNILINSQCVAKICDFGLIRSLNAEDHEEIVLSEQVATKWYRAPELLLSSRNYGKPVDMWSLGCIVAEMLMGRPMFAGNSTLNQFEKILEFTGYPSETDIGSLQSPIAEQLVEQIKVKQRSFDDYFKNVDPDFYELLRSTLEFNPNKRITAEEALCLKLFEEFAEEPVIILGKPVVPHIDDNVRLNTKAYREKIYQDIEARYSPVPFREKINELRNRSIEPKSDKTRSLSYKKRVLSGKKNVKDRTLSTPKNIASPPNLVKAKKNSQLHSSPYYRSLFKCKSQQIENRHSKNNQSQCSLHSQVNPNIAYSKKVINKQKEDMNEARTRNSKKLIKRGAHNRFHDFEKRNILKSIGVDKGKKLVKYLK